MDFLQYVNRINTQEDYEKHMASFNNEIERQKSKLLEFSEQALKRLEKIKSWEENLEYRILGGIHKDGRVKTIVLIIRYPDGTQRDEKYSFNKIAELRDKLLELKEKYNCEDWSNFREDI